MGGFFDLFNKGFVAVMDKMDINDGYEMWKADEGALLVDVRETEEYAQGHLPGSVNIPLAQIGRESRLPAKDKKMYVYCLSGFRAGKACRRLMRAGRKAVCIGGLNTWRGDIEKK